MIQQIVVLTGHLNDLRVLYSQNKTPSTSTKKNARHIPQVPERILDAPDLIDDYCEFANTKLVLFSWFYKPMHYVKIQGQSSRSIRCVVGQGHHVACSMHACTRYRNHANANSGAFGSQRELEKAAN